MILNPTHCRTAPYPFQLIGAQRLIDQPCVALFDEMGLGKSKQVIDAACALRTHNLIDTVIVICPDNVRRVWMDEEFGQIVQHAWPAAYPTYLPYTSRHHNIDDRLQHVGCDRLVWLVLSYDFFRFGYGTGRWRTWERLTPLVHGLRGRRTLLVIDESGYVINQGSLQHKACFLLRQYVQRCVLLNGTPQSKNELDLYGQFRILDKRILGYDNWFFFRKHYARLGGFKLKQVVGVNNPEEIIAKTAPYVLRRLRREVRPDLPGKLPPQFVEVKLTPATWRHYVELRDNLITWLSDQPATARNGGARVVRLSQLTAGFLGGLSGLPEAPDQPVYQPPEASIVQVGEEKVNALKSWLGVHDIRRAVVWCRFQVEMDALAAQFQWRTRQIRGGQAAAERRAALKEGLAATDDQPTIMIAQPQAGALGISLVSFHDVAFLSNVYSHRWRLQAEDRCDRDGQTHPVSYTDFLATGPAGQRTIDHTILKSLRRQEDAAQYTTRRWAELLREERDDGTSC